MSVLERFALGGRAAVVTGAASGIGRETARVLAMAGADVVLADRDRDGLAAAADAITYDAPDSRVVWVPTDVTDKEQVDQLADRAVADLEGLDIWANVAGVLRYSPITETTEAGLAEVLDVNLKGTYWGVAAAGRAMRARGSGSIVNVTSAGGDMPSPNLSVYGLTKAAVAHLTKTAAMEFGSSGVRVNAVAPGFIDTAMVSVHWTDAEGRVDEEQRRHMLSIRAAQSPLSITGEPSDIAYAILYLAGDAARFVTGQVLRPNGGVVMP